MTRLAKGPAPTRHCARNDISVNRHFVSIPANRVAKPASLGAGCAA
jgi:hypothetical protein